MLLLLLKKLMLHNIAHKYLFLLRRPPGAGGLDGCMVNVHVSPWEFGKMRVRIFSMANKPPERPKQVYRRARKVTPIVDAGQVPLSYKPEITSDESGTDGVDKEVFVSEAAITSAPRNRSEDPQGSWTSTALSKATMTVIMDRVDEAPTLKDYLPVTFQRCLEWIPDDLVNVSEEYLLRELKARYDWEPYNTIEVLRNNFWVEYDRIQVTKEKKIIIAHIFHGVCTVDSFYNYVSNKKFMPEMAYFFTKPISYEASMAGLLSLANRRIRDILTIPLKKDDGTMQDPKLLELVLKASAMVDLRAKGGYIQRSETKNLTLMEQRSLTGTVGQVFGDGRTKRVDDLTPEEVELRIKQLEEEEKNMSLPAPSTDIIVQKNVVKRESDDGQY